MDAVSATPEEKSAAQSLYRSTSVRSATSVVSSMGSSDDGAPFSNQLAAYELLEIIGFGASAMVYAAIFKPDGRRVAVKIIDLDAFERTQIDQLRREIQNLSLCRHPNVLRTYGSFVDNTKLYIITPYLAGGSCLDIMKYAHSEGFEEAMVATILKQALSGLVYMHRQGFIHRDVKAGNMLLDNDGTVMLADFGVSSSLTETGERRGQRKTFVGTPCWMAPEVMEQSPYDTKADIWSFGITCLELATGNAPYAKYPPLKVLMLTLNNDPPTLDRDKTKHKYSRTFKDLIDLCLQKDPNKRPTAEKLLQHNFFTKAKKPQHICATLLKGLAPLETRQLKLPSQKQHSLQRTISWDFSDDNTNLENDDGADTNAEAHKKGVRFKEIAVETTSQTHPINSSSSSETTKEKKGRFMINDDDDDDDNDDSEHDQLDGSTELAMSASMELVPDPDGKASGVQKGRFSVMNDSDDSDNEEQPDGCDGNQSNNSIHQDTNDAFDKTHSHSLSQSRNLSSDLDFVASLDFSSHESTSLSRQNSGSSYLPTRPSRLNAAHLFDPPPHEPSPQQQQQQQQIDVLLLLPPDRHVPDPDTQSLVSSQHGRRGRFEVTSDDTEDDSEVHMYPDMISLPSPTSSPLPRFFSVYNPTSSSHSTHLVDHEISVGFQAQLDALHRQGEIQRTMLANLCHQMGTIRSDFNHQDTSPTSILATLTTLQQQLSTVLQENASLHTENANLRREIDGLEQVLRTRSNLSINTQSQTTATSISSLTNNTPNRSYRSTRSNPSDTQIA